MHDSNMMSPPEIVTLVLKVTLRILANQFDVKMPVYQSVQVLC